MIRTRVGYAGGTTQDPTYYDLGDHSEAVQIDYDPAVVSYEELLDVFWASHNPRSPSITRQYARVLFYHNEEQESAALRSKARQETVGGGPIWTEIVPVSEFYLAEDYHQKYQLRRQRELESEFTSIYPESADLRNSTAAARVNGYLGGNGTPELLQAEVESYGLSTQGRERLLDILAARWGSVPVTREAEGEVCPL